MISCGRVGGMTGGDGDDAAFGRALGDVRQLELADEATVRAELFARMGIAPIAPRLGGRYTLGRRLGSGGSGAVYAARDDKLGRDVAIKLVRVGGLDGFDDSASEGRLRREARAIARLAHPNIVAVFDLGRYDFGELGYELADAPARGLYLVMELVDGGDLAGWAASGASFAARIEVLIGVARGLHAAHGAGLVHRDVKPANVIIAHDGTPKLADFGLARPPAETTRDAGSADDDEAPRDDVTAHGTVVGTLPYMAPEQFGGSSSAASDQYAFCVTAVEILLGERPFVGDASEQLAAKRAGRAPALERLPPRLRAALQRGLCTDPADRFGSMLELSEALAPAPQRRFALVGAAALLGIALAGWIATPDDACAPLARAASAVERMPSAAALAATLEDEASRLRATHAACLTLDDPDTRACMGQRGRQHERLLASLGDIDAPAMLRAFHALPPADECVALRAVASAPPEALRDGVDAVHEFVVTARALADAGELESAAVQAGHAIATARRLDWPPALVEASIVHAHVEFGLGRVDAAEIELVDAYWSAVELGNLPETERAAEHLAHLHGRPGGDRGEAERWEKRANASLDGMGRPPFVEARLAAIRGANRNAWHDEPAAIVEFRHALALLEAQGLDYRRQIATLSSNLGEMLTRTGQHAEAERMLLRAIELGDPEGIASVPALMHLSTLRRSQQRLDEADALIRDAIARLDTAAPAGHPWRGQIFNNLGVIATLRPDFASAADAFATAVRSHEQLGLRDAAWAGYHKNWATAAARMHEWSTAIEHFEIALAVLTSADPRRDQALVGLAEANLELGDVSAAATRLREVDPSLLARDASMVAEVDALRARITAAEAERIGSPE
ncbi:MAG: serine/threonine protein kinase [Deltaproteobacteria bacterium]|nr:serine/threonine protein kinase [Deltaproteobacteria bacterium]